MDINFELVNSLNTSKLLWKALTHAVYMYISCYSLFPPQDKLSELELQHSNLQELLGALRDHSKTSTAAAKLTEWHAKLGEMRLTEMRNNRISDRSAIM